MQAPFEFLRNLTQDLRPGHKFSKSWDGQGSIPGVIIRVVGYRLSRDAPARSFDYM